MLNPSIQFIPAGYDHHRILKNGYINQHKSETMLNSVMHNRISSDAVYKCFYSFFLKKLVKK